MLAFLVDVVLQRLNSFKYGAVKHVITSHGGFWAPYLVWLVFTMGYSALSSYLVVFWAPLAAGSGIPEVKTYLNGVHIKGVNASQSRYTTEVCHHRCTCESAESNLDSMHIQDACVHSANRTTEIYLDGMHTQDAYVHSAACTSVACTSHR